MFRFLHRLFHQPDSPGYRRVELVLWVLIILSVSLTGLELYIGEDQFAALRLDDLDFFVLLLFLVEITLRVGTFIPADIEVLNLPPSRRMRAQIVGRLRFLFQPLNLFDLLTVIALHPAMRGLRALRVLRLARSFRVTRSANPFEHIWFAIRDNALLFGFAFLVLAIETLIGGVTIYLIERDTNPMIQTIGDGTWWTLVTLTTVGYGDISPATAAGRAWAALLMVAGMITLALFAGIVGNTLLRVVLTIRQEQFRMVSLSNHVVILGYESACRLMLDVLLEELGDDQRDVLLMGSGPRPTELPPHFHWVDGDPSREAELNKVHLTHACTLVVLGSRALAPQHADANTILSVFTARRYLQSREHTAPRKRPVHIVAEILDPENVDHARTAGTDEVIESTRVGFALLAHTVTQPGSADIMTRVVSAGAHSMYVGLPGELTGGTFAAAAAYLKHTHRLLLIGLRDGRYGPTHLNPDDATVIGEEHQLIYLATQAVLPEP